MGRLGQDITLSLLGDAARGGAAAGVRLAGSTLVLDRTLDPARLRAGLEITVLCNRTGRQGGQISFPVHIRTTSVNDQAPVWSSQVYSLNITEASPVGAQLIEVGLAPRSGALNCTVPQVSAEDGDKPGPHSLVRYSVLPGPHAQ